MHLPEPHIINTDDAPWVTLHIRLDNGGDLKIAFRNNEDLPPSCDFGFFELNTLYSDDLNDLRGVFVSIKKQMINLEELIEDWENIATEIVEQDSLESLSYQRHCAGLMAGRV